MAMSTYDKILSNKRYLGNDKFSILWAAKLQLVCNVGQRYSRVGQVDHADAGLYHIVA